MATYLLADNGVTCTTRCESANLQCDDITTENIAKCEDLIRKAATAAGKLCVGNPDVVVWNYDHGA